MYDVKNADKGCETATYKLLITYVCIKVNYRTDLVIFKFLGIHNLTMKCIQIVISIFHILINFENLFYSILKLKKYFEINCILFTFLQLYCTIT